MEFGRLNLGFEKPNLESKKPDLGSERPYLGPKKLDLRLQEGKGQIHYIRKMLHVES